MTVALASTRKRLGVLTPSSNTVLEPVIVRVTAGLPNLSAGRPRDAIDGKRAATIIKTFANESVEIVAERRLNFTNNFSFAEATDTQILDMARQVGASRPDAILILCTNLRGAPLVEQIEREMGTLVRDSMVLGLLGGLRSISADFSHVTHAGQVCGWTWGAVRLTNLG